MKKKTILSIMDSLEKINDSVIRNLDSGVQVSMETLVDCQDSAIAVGNEIEQQYGAAGEEAVHLLEAYCENLYQMSSKSEDLVSCRKLGKKIQKQLVQIRNHIKYDLPDDKKEVVFLPYKASMWDSLESVWRAVDADPDCDAYVIPIPYFDKNPDGSFREEHYEGDLYPKDVPVIRYDEYDLEARHPDIIYIHNPYDECNHVTSVHPYFYSKNLRNFTDKLVYIPYFILGEIDPDNQAAIDGMKHFCFTPGTIYADQVVVQSENMRQIYINEYMKAAKEMGLGGEHMDRKFLEKKFLGTGSPKLDKVQNTRKEDLEIPEDWLRIIEKPDGSWKKIVFYNTSVSALLHNDEKMLRKMESVFGIFKENKDEVALLWRPHPLIQATIESMRPQLWEEYQRIKDRYIEEDWGIYDDSADLDRAVVVSDAYYGDGSSVVQLCQKAGMPVMVQNVDLVLEVSLKRDDYIAVSVIDAVVDNDIVWFIPYSLNGLFYLNLKDREVKLIGRISDEAYWKKRLYESMKLIGNKIYFIPFYATSIIVFNISNRVFKSMTLDKKKTGCRIGQALYGGCEIYGKYLYVIPIFSKAIVRIDTENDEVEYIIGWAEEVEKLRFNCDAYFKRQIVLLNDKLMLPFCNANAVMELDCKTGKYIIYQLGEESRGYSGICFDGENLWLSPREDGDLVQWDLKKNQVKMIKFNQSDKLQKNVYPYVGVLYNGQKIMVFSSVKKRAVEIENIQVVLQEGIYSFAKEEDDNLIYFQKDSGQLILINKKNNWKTAIDIRVKHKDLNKKQMIEDSQETILENEFLNVKDIIEILMIGDVI